MKAEGGRISYDDGGFMRQVVTLAVLVWLVLGLVVIRSPILAQGPGENFLTYPFPWNENMYVVAGWEYSDGTYHGGIDYVKGHPRDRGSWEHFDVLAAAPGEACWKSGGGNDPGRTVIILHAMSGSSYETRYIHLASVVDEIPPCPQKVTVYRGAKIGIAGDRSWDRCKPPCIHLHFAVLRAGRVVDPYDIYARSGRYPQPNGRTQGTMGPLQRWIGDPPDHPDEDSRPPSIQFVLPRLNTWYNADARISWHISDEGGSGVKGYNWAWDRDPGGMPPVQRTDNGLATLSQADVGVHSICVRAWDGRGNEVFLSHGWIGYDPFPPTRPGKVRELNGAPDGSPQQDVRDPQFVWDEAVDMVSGIAGYHVYWGISPTGTASNWTDTPTYDPGPVEPGTYYLRVQAQDVAGNTSPWETLFTLVYTH